jgi:hypothetical protein
LRGFYIVATAASAGTVPFVRVEVNQLPVIVQPFFASQFVPIRDNYWNGAARLIDIFNVDPAVAANVTLTEVY